jgi:predicted RNase H-like nuclease
MEQTDMASTAARPSLLTSRRWIGEALRFAGEPDRDGFGLPIAIWA